MRTLSIESLCADRVDQAYPLVQMLRPGLTAAAWRRYALGVVGDPQAGIAALENHRGVILGLFVWRVSEDPDHGRTLLAGDFVALDIVDTARVAEALAEGLEATARARGCRAVHTHVSADAGDGARRLVERLHRLGHRMESFQLCKPLHPV